MLLTISTTHAPATDLGYLLHKNPARAQSFDLAFGRAHVVYPEATDARCTAALVLDVDPVALVRGRGARPDGRPGEGGPLAQYVNDRPYVASSFLSVAIAEVFGTAMAGRSRDRPALAAERLPLVAHLPAVPSRGDGLLHRLFEPLGYEITAEPRPLPFFPEEVRYHAVTLAGRVRLADLLSHLYVLLPVLDGGKHYWVGDAEVEKLLRRGEGWLAAHPERDLIARCYLKHRTSLVRDAVARLAAADDAVQDGVEDAVDEADAGAGEAALDAALDAAVGPAEASAGAPDVSAFGGVPVVAAGRGPSLHEQRLAAVLGVLREAGAASLLDLGCGEGRLLRLLLDDPRFTRVVGMDVSHRALEIAAERLRLDRMPAVKRERLTLLHGSLLYRDARLAGFDAAAVVEVVEHLDPPRLAAFERAVFEFARPGAVVLTTPNAEYNVRWAALPAGAVRHVDHRFEWTRAEFTAWSGGVAARFGYTVRVAPVGPVDAEVGAPSQMAVFTRGGR